MGNIPNDIVVETLGTLFVKVLINIENMFLLHFVMARISCMGLNL
jgi:hypothetical protein